MQMTLTPCVVSQWVMVKLSRPPKAAKATCFVLEVAHVHPCLGSFWSPPFAIDAACRFVDCTASADGSSPRQCAVGAVGSSALRSIGGQQATWRTRQHRPGAHSIADGERPRTLVTTLARKLNLARATIQERIDRLKRNGVSTVHDRGEAGSDLLLQITACVPCEGEPQGQRRRGLEASRIKRDPRTL